MKHIFYVDGSCYKNPGPGAYAVLKIYPNELIYTESFTHTTNNQMELCALIKALELSNTYSVIFSDSKYAVDGYNDWIIKWAESNWKKKIENLNLWKRVWELKKNFIHVEWVKAHHNNIYNNRVDLLARNAVCQIPF